jgi:RNA polymerase sigma-70 factor (ECF subfamily)
MFVSALSPTRAPLTAPPRTREVADTLAELRPAICAVIAAVLREGRGHPDVEDGAHEVFRRALEGQSRLTAGEPLRPWVIGIARHVALDLGRSRRRGRARSEGDASLLAERDQIPHNAPSPEQLALDHDRGEQMMAALALLPDGHREALRLVHVEGFAYQDAADRLGVPLGTIATWIARARKSLTAQLSNPEDS